MAVEWSINGGATNGIPAARPADAADFALFPFDASAADLRDPSKAVGDGQGRGGPPGDQAASRSRPTSQLDRDRPTRPSSSACQPRLAARLEGDAAACEFVKKAINIASPEGKPSLFIRVSDVGETPEFRLIARDGQFIITKPTDDRPLVAEIDGLNEAGARLAVQRLEHIARWTQIARLSNPASTIQPGDVKLTVLVDDREVSGAKFDSSTNIRDGKAIPPTFQVSMTNNSQRTLFCGLLDLTQRYRVDAGLIRAGCIKIEPGQIAWANLGNPIPATVPDELWKQGVIEYKDLLKLIVSHSGVRRADAGAALAGHAEIDYARRRYQRHRRAKAPSIT